MQLLLDRCSYCCRRSAFKTRSSKTHAAVFLFRWKLLPTVQTPLWPLCQAHLWRICPQNGAITTEVWSEVWYDPRRALGSEDDPASLVYIQSCGEPAISLHSYIVPLVQWSTRLLPIMRDPGPIPWGYLHRDSRVSVVSLQSHQFSSTPELAWLYQQLAIIVINHPVVHETVGNR
jgi:hypothetical protein